jgi:hypothetical protein
MCVSATWIRSCVALQAQRPPSASPNSEALLSLLGCNLQSGGETALNRCVRTVVTHVLARLFTGHHRARSAVTGLYTVRALCTVIRLAALETDGLIPWCQPTCPVCQWQAALFDLGAPGPATALNAGRWRGDPQGASSRRHAAGPAPIPPQDVTWQRRTPSRGKRGGPGPKAGRSGLACDGRTITRGTPGPP